MQNIVTCKKCGRKRNGETTPMCPLCHPEERQDKSGLIPVFTPNNKTLEKLKSYAPDVLEDIRDNNLVQLTRDVLNSFIQSTDLLNPQEMSSERMNQLKIFMGLINASTKVMQTKVNFLNITGLKDKIREVKKQNNL